MTKIKQRIYITTLLLLTLIASNTFANENYPNTSIAIVDLNLILSDSKLSLIHI